MEQKSVVERLIKVDKELHLFIEELKTKENIAPTLEELRESFRNELVSDDDPTELIRKMRDKNMTHEDSF